MAKTAQVTLHGRFRPGAVVRLVKVKDETVLRAEGGDTIGTETVDDTGRVQFTDGVEAGCRYFIVGQVDGTPLEVRARGNVADEENSVLATAPVQPDPQKRADGTLESDAVLPGGPRQAEEHPIEQPAKKRAPAKRSAAKAPAKKSASSKAPASRAPSTKAKKPARGPARKG